MFPGTHSPCPLYLLRTSTWQRALYALFSLLEGKLPEDRHEISPVELSRVSCMSSMRVEYHIYDMKMLSSNREVQQPS